MLYQSYKNRVIDFSEKAMIYKNLHNGLFSVKQKGLVVAHIESFKMSSVVFKVVESGRQRVIKEKQKNIHAFIIGYLCEINCNDNDLIVSNPHTMIRYNPYRFNSFVIGVNEFPIFKVCNMYGCCKSGIVML